MRRPVSGLVLAIALVTALAGCAQEPTSPNGSEANSESEVDIPSGFTSGGFGLATKWSTPEACEGSGSARGCVVVEVFAYEDCSLGAYIEANVVDADLVVVESTRRDFDSLPLGETDRIELSFESPNGVHARQTAARCN